MAMLTNAPKGTKDIMPDQVYKWHYVEKKWKEICDRYGFKEIRTPMFEHTELFQRGIGDTTDVVQKEMYTFNDHGGRSITLKPEGTSPAVRAFLEHKTYAEVQPTKIYHAARRPHGALPSRPDSQLRRLERRRFCRHFGRPGPA